MRLTLRSWLTAGCACALLIVFSVDASAQRVLIVAADDPAAVADVKAKLTGTHLLTAVDVFDASAATPTAAVLGNYDAVLTWSDSTYADPVALGNVLADFVDGGHGVVQAVFSYYPPASGAQLGLDGRWMAGGYAPFASAEIDAQPGMTLLPDVAGHAILAGVGNVNNGQSGFYQAISSMPDCSQVIAHWSNGQPVIVVGCPAAGAIVGLNFYPPSSDSRSDLWDATTDGARMMANALMFTAPPAVPADVTPPVLSGVPASPVDAVATGASGAAVALPAITAMDAVDGPRPVVCGPTGVFPIGDTLVTCTAADTHGNTAAATFTVHVADVTTPGRMRADGEIRQGGVRYRFGFDVYEHDPRQRATLLLSVDGSRGNSGHFVATTTDFVAFSDDVSVRSKHGMQVDSVSFSGAGEWNGRGGYRYAVRALDAGQSGRQDTFSATITAPDGTVVAQVDGTLSGGNIQSLRLVRW